VTWWRVPGAAGLLLIASLTAGAGATGAPTVVIRADHLEPRVLQATTADRVTFVNATSRVVHVEFQDDAARHRVFQVPGRIWARFHRPGRHPYVVHFETGGGAPLEGVVEVGQAPGEAGPPTCSSLTVEGICLAP
jgi:hypothetical protein